MSFPEQTEDHKVRGKPDKFAEHYNQARLFYNSQSEIEQAHIVRAFRFELTKVQTPAIRRRMVAGLRNVDEDLAQRVADGLGMELPDALPRAIARPPRPEVTESSALSLLARPGAVGIQTRHVALLVADGVQGASLAQLHELLAAQGAVPRFVGVKLGAVECEDGAALEAEVSMETTPAVLYDALVIPDGGAGTQNLLTSGHALECLKDAYRHCKTILVLGTGAALLDEAGIPPVLPDGSADTGLLQFEGGDVEAAAEAFAAALSQHRHFARETDPPII